MSVAIEYLKRLDGADTSQLAVVGACATGRYPLIAAADRAMYQAKAAGRNRVFLVGAQPSPSQVLLDDKECMVVQALTATALAHDWEMGSHVQRVADLTEATARILQPREAHSLVRVAALLHDIGKIGIPDAVLHKPDPLTEEAGLSEYVGPGS